MPKTIQYTEGILADLPAMAGIRAMEWGTEAFWEARIAGYMKAEHHPQHALIQRIVYVAMENEKLIGFIAGHLTRRFDCTGELQWVNVIPAFQGSGVASGLLKSLAACFAAQKSLRVCVNVDPSNMPAQNFYKKHGAKKLNEHWLVWEDISMVLKEP